MLGYVNYACVLCFGFNSYIVIYVCLYSSMGYKKEEKTSIYKRIE